MNDVQRHRGAETELHINGRIGLGNRRASMLDPKCGQHLLSVEPGIWITFSGQVFNRAELQSDLAARGHTCQTNSDAEVVLLAYQVFGPSVVERLNGQFAFAIWDPQRAELFLARDALGIAPLHYTTVAGQFVFASEAKAVLQHPSVYAAVDQQALAEAMLCGATFDGRTMFSGVQSLEPGSRLMVSAAGAHVNRYWTIPTEGDAMDDGSSVSHDCEHLLELMQDAVRLRMKGDSSWGILLSGGLDSSTLTALARRMTKQPLNTFTIDFPNVWRGQDVDARFAELVATRFETHHRLFMANFHEYFAVLEELAWHLERPYNKAVPTAFLLYRKMASQAAFVFSGEGMDELMGGYVGARGFGVDEVAATGQIDCFPWAPHVMLVKRLFSAEFEKSIRPAEMFAERLSHELALCRAGDSVSQALQLYSRHFVRELIELHDNASWAAGIETRLPFLDRRVVEFISTMPLHLKIRDGQGKFALRQVAAELLPSEVLNRRKSHLPIPRDPQSSAAHLGLARDLLLGSLARVTHYFDSAALSDFLEQRQSFAGTDALVVWQVSMNLMTLELFLRRYNL